MLRAFGYPGDRRASVDGHFLQLENFMHTHHNSHQQSYYRTLHDTACLLGEDAPERSQGQDPDLVLQIWGISEIGDPNTVP